MPFEPKRVQLLKLHGKERIECPSCGVTLDKIFCEAGVRRPKKGSALVCNACGEILEMIDSAKAKPATTEFTYNLATAKPMMLQQLLLRQKEVRERGKSEYMN